MKQENQNYDLTKRPAEEVVEPIPEEQLNQEAKLRAKKRPLLEKIIRLLKREDEPYREIVINVEPFEKRVALLVEGVMQKFEIERNGDESMVGAIFKGKIQNLEPGLKAAFVDIGQPKNAFLHYWDIFPTTTDNSYEVVRENKSKEQKKAQKFSTKDIPEKFPIGTEIIVQITKTQIGTKGPRVTTNIAIPGRYLVLMPFAGQFGISRKIEDRAERERIKKILKSMKVPEGMGVIVRTAGQGKRWTYFVRDLHMLLNIWKKIQQRIETVPAPATIYKEPDLIERTVRDFLTEQTDRILIDSREDYERILRSVSEISRRARSKIQLFKENIPIFERYNIERQIAQTFQRRVPLPSGGEIVIDETEALVAIDVNTGSHKGKSEDGKDFILQANLEAVTEAARQVRLRNLGGLVIIDTIDMKSRKDRAGGLQTPERRNGKGQGKEPSSADFAARHHADDASAPRAEQFERHLHDMPVLRRQGHCEIGADDECGNTAQDCRNMQVYAGKQRKRGRACAAHSAPPRQPPTLADGRLRTPHQSGKGVQPQIDVPRRPVLPLGEFQDYRRPQVDAANSAKRPPSFRRAFF